MRLRQAIITLTFLIFVLIIAGAVQVVQLNRSLGERLKLGWFLPPVQFYSSGQSFTQGTEFDVEKTKSFLQGKGFRERASSEPLFPSDYSLLEREPCAALIGQPLDSSVTTCLVARPQESHWAVIAINGQLHIDSIFQGPQFSPTHSVSLGPTLLAQFVEGQPIFKEPTEIAKVPLFCLQAVTAIEDADFLKHKGVSLIGSLRAVVRNVLAGHWAEGGSTITQQLVKNYFLTAKKTMQRKITEQVLALLLEYQTSKDTILEQYLNVIFMGLAGSYQIRGFASAAQYYFGKNVSELDLSECASLAAIINSPGRYNPFEHPDNLIKRREIVLQKMLKQDEITLQQLTEAKQKALPRQPPAETKSLAPYYLQAAQKELEELGINQEQGLKIYTALITGHQESANRAVSERMNELEKTKTASTPYEASLVSVERRSHRITALVGGRSYQKTQYNRAIESHRQIGSLAKPFVYLASMETLNPLSERIDEPYEYKYGKLTWKPKNYEKKFMGKIPLFFALAESQNIPAAKTAIEIGLNKVSQTFQNAGIERTIPEHPALSLGAIDLSPLEVAQMYSTLADLGVHRKLHTIVRVDSLDDKQIWSEDDLQATTRFKPEAAAEVLGMLMMTPILGTAQAVKKWHIPQQIAAKTGTTNDLKDAWFFGLVPDQFTITWVGHDDNSPTGTGAQMALPIWAKFHETIAETLPSIEFTWPDTVAVSEIPWSDLKEKYEYLGTLKSPPESVSLIFLKWTH